MSGAERAAGRGRGRVPAFLAGAALFAVLAAAALRGVVLAEHP